MLGSVTCPASLLSADGFSSIGTNVYWAFAGDGSAPDALWILEVCVRWRDCPQSFARPSASFENVSATSAFKLEQEFAQ